MNKAKKSTKGRPEISPIDSLEHNALSLGPLPWGREVVEAAVWRYKTDVFRFIEEHPGYEYLRRLESLKSILMVFKRSVSRFEELFNKFETQASDGTLFLRMNRGKLQNFELEAQEALYIFVASSMSLVDQSRILSEKIEISGYSDEKKVFANSPEHKFIQELRVDLIHLRLHQPNWETSRGRKTSFRATFKIWVNDLKRLGEYAKLAQEFVTDNSTGIDLRELIPSYNEKVITFHEWFHSEIEKTVGEQIQDYQRCVNIAKSVSEKSFWQMLFKQIVLPKKLDPYDYLDRYLSPNELEEVGRFPKRSIAQVERIISFIDEHGACDDELRALVHSAFQVEEKET